jgi:ADP-ribosylglycohydrolase
VNDILPSALAALGAVVGLVFGAIVSGILGSLLGFDSDVPAMVVGGLAGAVGLAWLGLRLSRRLSKPSAESKSG